MCMVKLLGQSNTLYTQNCEGSNTGKAKVFKAVGEEGEEVYGVYTDRERETHQGY